MKINPIRSRIFAMFDADDRAFLSQFFAQHPRIGDNFLQFINTPALLRPALAQKMIHQIPRTGWVRYRVTQPETVGEHVEGLAKLVGDYLAEQGAPARQRERLMAMARVHDVPEAIASDFTRHDPICSEDKHRIEWLAARVIFEHPTFSDKLELVKEHMDQQTPDAQLLSDFDKIHAVRMAAYYQARDEQKDVRINDKTLWDEFCYCTPDKMKTAAGKTYLAEVLAHPQQHAKALRVMEGSPQKPRSR